MKILITGGAGYIGSHTCVELLNSGYEIVVIDNLINSKEESLKRVKKITGKNFKFYKCDLLDKKFLEKIFDDEKFEAVIHFAGLKAVGESIKIPLKYYLNNLVGSLNLFEVMKEKNVKNLVFSSSATVYGVPEKVPICENFPLSVTNPYGRTKLMIEEILRDVYNSDNSWKIILLRYFNPVGAHENGLIGEDPNGIPNNLMPYVAQVASGKLSELKIFGKDYPTKDGTGVRDYIHVVDLAKGHLKAMEKIFKTEKGIFVYNLGTGNGISVLEMINAFEKTSGKKISYQFVERREGDVAECYANTELAEKDLNWKAEKSIFEMCKDLWNWQSKNPNGYE